MKLGTKGNAILMFFYQVSMYIVPLITMPYVARVLGAYGLGVYSYSASIMSFCVVITTMGVSLYGQREIASCLNKEQRTRTFWSIYFIETTVFLLTLLVYFLSVSFSQSDIKLALYFQIFTLIGAWLDISWLFFGVENFKIAILRNILVRIISLVSIFLFIHSESDVYLYCFILTFSDFISAVPLWFRAGKYIGGYAICNIRDIKARILPMFKMMLPAISINLFSIVDKIILGSFVALDAVGIYDNAFRISKFSVAFITTIGVVMLPRMTNLYAEGRNEMSESFFKKSLSLTLFLGAGCSFGLMTIAPTLIPLYLGEGFYDAIIVTQILSVVLIIIAWGNVFRTQFIIPRKMDNLYVHSVIGAAVLNIILNLVLIPLFGIIGAASSYVVTEIAMTTYQTIKVRHFLNIKEYLLDNLKYLLSAILMMVSVSIFGNFFIFGASITFLLLQILIGFVSYLAFVCVLEYKSSNRIVLTEIIGILNLLKHEK